MYESTVDKACVIAWSMWVGVACVSIAALGAAAADLWHISVLLGLLAGVLSPAAAVAHIRLYAIGVATLVRRQGDRPPVREPLQPVRL